MDEKNTTPQIPTPVGMTPNTPSASTPVAEDSGSLVRVRTFTQDVSSAQSGGAGPTVDVEAILRTAKPPKVLRESVNEGSLISRHQIPKVAPTIPLTAEQEKQKKEEAERAQKTKEEAEKRRTAEEARKKEKAEAEVARKKIAEEEQARRAEEEARKKEKADAIRLKQEEDEKAIMQERKVTEITQQQERLRINLSILNDKKTPLSHAKETFLQEKKAIEATLAPITQQAQKIESILNEITHAETTAVNPAKKKEIEEKRWKAEDIRRRVEKEKWEVEATLGDVIQKIENNTTAQKKIEDEEMEIHEEDNGLAKEKRGNELHILLREISKTKDELEARWVLLDEQKETMQKALTPTLHKEKEIEAQEKELSDKVHATLDMKERRLLEKQRWDVEDARREVEKERQIKETEMSAVNEVIGKLKPQYQDYLKQGEEARAELSALNSS